MKRKKIVLLGALLALSTFAQSSPKVKVTSELSLPVMLEKSTERNYLKVSLTGFALDNTKRVPINLALVIDRSTSMHGDRIQNAKEAAILAINMLDTTDTISVIAYDSDATVLIPATKVIDKAALIKVINTELTPRGWTALFAGVSKGLNQVTQKLDPAQVNRIILLSDGQANVGPTSIKELADLAKIAAKKGVAITTIGLGNDYNEDLMTAIAGYSDGNHAYVQKPQDLEAAFVHEFDDVMAVVAQEVEVIIKLKGEVKPLRLLGREGVIEGDTVRVRLNQLYSNQEKYVLLEVAPESGRANEEKPLAEVSVHYTNLSNKKVEVHKNQVAVRYTKSQKNVEAAMVGDILVEKAIQDSVIAQEQALELYQAGRHKEAEEKVKAQAVSVQAASNAPNVSSIAKARSSERSLGLEQVQKAIDPASKKNLMSAPELNKSFKADAYQLKNQSEQPAAATKNVQE